MVKLYYGSTIEHNAQILTGWNLLTSGKCCISSMIDENLPPFVVVADIDGRKIAYDTCDGYFHTGAIAFDSRYESLANSVDILFKRDFSSMYNKLIGFKGRIAPLGLNYYCYDRRIKQIYYPGIRLYKKNVKNMLSIEFDEFYKNFENHRSLSNDRYDILFLTRLWNPEAVEVENAKVAEERHTINKMRINIIRMLRKQYGDKAVCGISDDPYAREIAPDLIIKDFTKKSRYISLMKKSKIVVSSLGLHQSNGWKFGEYIAAGKTIVTEKPFYNIPYALHNKNWLEYSCVEECLEAIDRLLGDSDKRNQMQLSNLRYYEEHLRPDMLIKDSLKKIGIENL